MENTNKELLQTWLTTAYTNLKADFPKEAYSVDSSRGFNLTSLKAQYAVERLNDSLGIAGWKLSGEYKETEKGILYMGSLNLVFNGDTVQSVEAIGYSDNKKNIGDTYKSARTDALSKASSYLGLGNEMFKGNIAPPVKNSGKQWSGKKSTTKTVDSKQTTTGSGFSKPDTGKSKVKNTGASDGWQ